MRMWSPQQENIFKWGTEDRGSAIVQAVAGAGKTTTLIEFVMRVAGRIVIMAFNKAIAVEIQAKLDERGADKSRVEAGTVHSFGWQAWRKANAGCKIDNSKIFNLNNSMHVPFEYRSFVMKSVGLARQWGIGLFSAFDDAKEWRNIVDRFDLAETLAERGEKANAVDIEARIVDATSWAIRVLKESVKQAPSVVDFDDMLYMPLLRDVQMFQRDWVLIDEAQDTNPVRLALAKKMLRPGGRLVAVGDSCQPLGTQVMTPTGPVDIETLAVGDLVISADISSSAFLMGGKEITGITRKPFDGELVTVTTSKGHHTQYTPHHRCIANFEPLRNMHAVYLMRRGEQFRVGVTKMSYNQSLGPVARMHAEGADAVWILECHTSAYNARVAEAVISAKFGVPQLMFTAKNTSKIFTDDVLRQAWNHIGANTLQADMCLAYFGRDMRYPLIETHGNMMGQTYSLKRPREVRACNLMDGVLVLPFAGKSHFRQAQWLPITVTRTVYTGDVVSLDVETYHNYVAIYGFSGADSESLNKIAQEFNAIELPLTVTYRCPKSIVAHARQWVSHIEAHESAPEGSVTVMQEVEFLKLGAEDLRVDDVILCRNTKPLVELAFAYIRRGMACHVEGRDIGQGLIVLTKKWKSAKTVKALRGRLEKYMAKEIETALAKGQESRAALVEDKVQTLLVIMDQFADSDSVEMVVAKINTIFSTTEDGQPAQSLTLSTIHKSKGREWDRVYWYGRNKFQPSPFARQRWQVEQEMNLQYVACTRARCELIEIEVPSKTKRQ
jgi:hypothetical protein